MKYIVIIAALILGFLGSQWANQHGLLGTSKTTSQQTETAYQRVMRTGTVRCGYALWPPFMAKDPNTGALSGFNYDIFNAIGKELGLKIEWVEEVGFGNFIEGLKTDRYDAMCETGWPDPGRFKNTTVTLPVHYHKVYVVVRADDKRFDQGYEQLNSDAYTAAAVDGDVTQSIAMADFPKAKIDALPQNADASQIFTEVATGKADATFVDIGFFQSYDKQNPGKLKIAGSVLHVYGSVFFVKAGEVDMKNLIDSAIISLTNKGVLADILRRVDPNSIPPAPTYAGAATP
ncbi:MAG TPA: transporter substrate-binding domain-containing protein [Alphaproteobacteria bacterium]|nr:transporter substrate-binding domain-containing protein [Alphaproteobacteria bacterium]